MDLNQVRYFIFCLTGSIDSIVTWQVFYDPKDGIKRPDLAAHFNADLNNALPTLERAQLNNCGVYVSINENDGKGREIANVTRYRCLFADFDGQAEPIWPLTPHFTQKRDSTHGHAFWLIDEINDVDTFRSLQRRIATVCNTDTQVTDPARVVRVSGTKHFKNPAEPKLYTISSNNLSIPKYTISDITSAFALSDALTLELDQWVESRNAIMDGSGFEDNDVYRKRYITYVSERAEPAYLGSGSHTLYSVAAIGYDYGLPLNVTQEILWQYYDPRCEPSWSSTGERQHFNDTVERAYKYSKNAAGCRTAKAAFSAAPAIPPAPMQKTELEIVRQGDRISEVQAAIMLPMLTAKSSHYEFAQAFDGMVYDGCKIVCFNKEFYVYTGRSYKRVNDEIVKAKVQRFLSRHKPSDALTNGVFKVLRDLVTIEAVTAGTWLSTGKIDTNVICCKNGLLTLSDDGQPPILLPHSHDYFSFNEVDWNYNTNARCDNWLRFLDGLWDDKQLISQLQEWFGYCLTNDTRHQKFAIMIGKSRGGKGVTSTILESLVGSDNTCAPSLSNITKDSTLHAMSTSSLALIPDAHSVAGNKQNETVSIIKAITGCDPISFHRMYIGAATVKFPTRIVMSTNNMPEFVDPSGALMNRALVFPFSKSFAGREDLTLTSRLLAEIEGIAQWSILGLRSLQCNKRFTEACSGLTEKESIREDMNPLSMFIEDVLVEDDDAFITSQELYDAYELWCKQHRVHYTLSQAKLARILKSSNLALLPERKRKDGVLLRGFSGVSVIKFNEV